MGMPYSAPAITRMGHRAKRSDTLISCAKPASVEDCMNLDQQRRVRAVFDAVASTPPEAQEEFVRREAQGDLEVEKAVLRLLRASHSTERFLENPLADRFDFSVFQGMRLG